MATLLFSCLQDEGRGFSGTTGAQQHQKFSFGDFKENVINDQKVPKFLAEIFYFNLCSQNIPLCILPVSHNSLLMVYR